MIKKIRKVIKKVPNVPEGYWITNTPSQEEILDAVVKLVNKYNGKYIKYFEDHKYIKTGITYREIPVEYYLDGDICCTAKKIPIDICTLIFYVIVYIEVESK